MATATKKSLASRAGAAARKVVSRGKDEKATAAKKAPAKKAPAKTAKKSAKTTAPAKKAAPSKKAAATKAAPAKKAPAKKAAAKKAPAKKAPAKAAPVATKAPATKAAPAKKAVPVAAKAAATQVPAKKVPAKKAPARAASAAKLVVLEQEDPWTKAELNEVKKTLTDDVKRLTGELVEVEEDLAGMIANSGEGAGNDQADVGSASFERDQEMVIVNNARDMLEQSQHALERIADGTYGQCEICGNPIGKARLMAFPRATLCLTCKQREERR